MSPCVNKHVWAKDFWSPGTAVVISKADSAYHHKGLVDIKEDRILTRLLPSSGIYPWHRIAGKACSDLVANWAVELLFFETY